MRSFIVWCLAAVISTGIIAAICSNHSAATPKEPSKQTALDPDATVLMKKENKSWQDVAVFAIIVLCANLPLWIREVKKSQDFRKKQDTIQEIKTTGEDTKEEVLKMKGRMESMTTVCQLKHGAVNDILSEHASQIKDHGAKIFDLAAKEKAK